jgi:hypothetical protein
MPLSVSALEVGKCYLTNSGRVWRIVQVMPDGRVSYEQRGRHPRSRTSSTWKSGSMETQKIGLLLNREVPCDWTPEGDG